LLLAILKALVPQVNKQQTIGFRVFTYTQYLHIISYLVSNIITPPTVPSKDALTTRYS
jgi:hypothetical protein